MKFLLLLLVIGVAFWVLRGRLRGGGAAPPEPGKATKTPPAQAMLACAHCGVHLPQGDVVADADGRPFCSDAHRLAGPR